MDSTTRSSSSAAQGGTGATAGQQQAAVNKQETSIKIFRRFLKATRVNADEVVYDASAVVSRECYEAWLSNRAAAPSEPERVFQRSLSSHVTSVDGRQPFSPKEEEAILKVLRKKQIWLALFHLGSSGPSPALPPSPVEHIYIRQVVPPK